MRCVVKCTRMDAYQKFVRAEVQLLNALDNNEVSLDGIKRDAGAVEGNRYGPLPPPRHL